MLFCYDYTRRRMAPSGDVGVTLQNRQNDVLFEFLNNDEAKQSDETNNNLNSVNVKEATLHLFACCCYNCCCCCCSRLLGPWCGSDFCFKEVRCFLCRFPLFCFKITAGRDQWLYGLHLLCFTIHSAFVVLTYTAARGADMSVEVVRIKASWENRAEYSYEAVPSKHQILYIDALTVAFFGCSALMHGMWVLVGGFAWSKPFLWSYLDNCLCWWRWLEYSCSASTMLVAIGVITGLRDQNSLFCIFFLSVATMWCGFFTEVVSRPAKDLDGNPDYERWEGDKKGDTFVPRLKNYAWRMTPHALGFLPYCAAWAVIINNFFEQVDDLCDKLKENMPDFVPWIVYGCCVIFSTFTFVQWR